MKKKYIKVPKGYFDKLNFKIEFDWDLYFKIQRLATLEHLLKVVKKQIHDRKKK